MKNYFEILKNTALFSGIDEKTFEDGFTQLNPKIIRLKKNEYVFHEGDRAESIGIVISGEIQIVKDDYFGNRSIIARAESGELFAEAFACAGLKSIPVSAFACAESEVLLISCEKAVNSAQNFSTFQNRLIYNLLQIVAEKNIALSRKIDFISQKTTRDKLLAYLSSQAKIAGNSRFSMPFNRQELADYLSVDRSAMSAELCRMRDDKIIEFRKNSFVLLKQSLNDL